MIETEINELVATGENMVCEFKRSFNVETIETLAAFAYGNPERRDRFPKNLYEIPGIGIFEIN